MAEAITISSSQSDSEPEQDAVDNLPHPVSSSESEEIGGSADSSDNENSESGDASATVLKRGKYKHYSLPFKLQVVQYAKSQQNNSAAARHFKVERKRVREWRKAEAKLKATEETNDLPSASDSDDEPEILSAFDDSEAEVQDDLAVHIQNLSI